MIDVYVYFQGNNSDDEKLYLQFCKIEKYIGHKCAGTVKIVDVDTDGEVYLKKEWKIADRHKDIKDWNLLINGNLGNKCNDEKLKKCASECHDAVEKWKEIGYKGKVMIDIEPDGEKAMERVSYFLRNLLKKDKLNGSGVYIAASKVRWLKKSNPEEFENLIKVLRECNAVVDLPCYSDCGDGDKLASVVGKYLKSIKVNPIIGISGRESRGASGTKKLLNDLKEMLRNGRVLLYQDGKGAGIDFGAISEIKNYHDRIHRHMGSRDTQIITASSSSSIDNEPNYSSDTLLLFRPYIASSAYDSDSYDSDSCDSWYGEMFNDQFLADNKLNEELSKRNNDCARKQQRLGSVLKFKP